MKILKNTAKIIFNIIVYLVIIILSIYVFLVIYQKVLKKSDLLSFNNYYLFQIASSSMETNLHIGDYIVVKKINDYKEGDIITFKDNETYITHRIHKIINGEIITKGDANEDLDGTINSETILGKVLFKLNILSFIIKYKYIIIAIIIAMFILESTFKDNKPKKGTDIEETNNKE